MIFIDTGPLLARHIMEDQYHHEAQDGWQRLAESRARLFTSAPVLAETFTLLARRAGYAFAAARARNILASRALVILRPTTEDELRAVEQFEKFADQDVSFTDCLSFVLMRRARLRRAFTFDDHFERAGFQRWP